MELPRPTRPAIVFGRFRLTPDPLGLSADGIPVAIGARALALLFALVQAEGRPVPFAELANRIWGRSNVEINSVQVQVSVLRRALGEDRDLIATMPGLGYRFTGAVQVSEVHGKAPAVSQRTASGPFRTALGIPAASPASEPLRRTPFIGRYAELSELLGLISMARVVTLAGAPGLGKTRLAQEVARRLAAHFRDGVAWVSLSPQVPPDSLVRRVARATKLESAHDVSTPEQLAAAVGARRLLLIVDCCGSSRACVGELVERLVANAPELKVIVTATEPLSIKAEQVMAVGTLSVPDRTDITIETALAFDAFRLLLARLAVVREGRQPARRRSPTDADLFAGFDLDGLSAEAIATAAWITRRLSGAPLALELAASAMARRMSEGAPLDATLGAFAHDLDARIARRAGRGDMPLSPEAALATVVGLLYDALNDDTRAQLRWLGIFSGAFTRQAAIDMLAGIVPQSDDNDADAAQARARHGARLDELLRTGLVECMAGESGGKSKDRVVLRLPGPVRLFATDALAQTDELRRVAAAHARSLAARLSADAGHGAGAPSVERDRIEREIEIDQIRAALKWSIFNDRFEVAIALIEASAPLWRELSLMHEYLRMIRTVLTRVGASATLRTREEMRLWKALAAELLLTQAPRHEAAAAWRKVYELASACADNVYRQHALAGLVGCLPETSDGGRPNASYDGFAQSSPTGRHRVEA